MISRALEKYIKISSKKLQPVTALIRKKKADEALFILIHTNKKGAGILKTVLESALANAKRHTEKKYMENELYISRLVVNQGPSLKRHRAMSMGRAGVIRKRTCHILIELDKIKEKSKKTNSKRTK